MYRIIIIFDYAHIDLINKYGEGWFHNYHEMVSTNWWLLGINISLNLIQFYCPIPFLLYSCGCYKDSMESRDYLRKLCFYMNIKHICCMIYLTFINWVVPDEILQIDYF